MIHARNDYNRFQEPKELVNLVVELFGKLSTHTSVSIEYQRKVKDIIDKYDIDETTDPIGENEPVFLLRAKDVFFPQMLRGYESIVRDSGMEVEEKDKIIQLIHEHCQRTIEWALVNQKNLKFPDVP